MPTPMPKVARAIRKAEAVLPSAPAAEGKRDVRRQVIITVGEFVESEPEAVWEFAARWGKNADKDLRAAVATCLLEHLPEHHFDLIFPRVRRLARESRRFAETFAICSDFGQVTTEVNAKKVARLRRERNRAT